MPSAAASAALGLELTSAQFKVTYQNGAVWKGQLFGDGSLGGGEAYAQPGLAGPLKLNVGSIDNGEKGVVAGINQVLEISGGPPGANVRVAVTEGVVGHVSPNPPTDLADPVFGANSAGAVKYLGTVLDGTGKGSVWLGGALEAGTDARYHISAVVTKQLDGSQPGLEAAGAVSLPVVLKVNPAGAPAAAALVTAEPLLAGDPDILQPAGTPAPQGWGDRVQEILERSAGAAAYLDRFGGPGFHDGPAVVDGDLFIA